MEENEFKNLLLGGTVLFVTLTCGLTVLQAGAENGNFTLGALGTTVCVAGAGLAYTIFKNTYNREI